MDEARGTPPGRVLTRPELAPPLSRLPARLALVAGAAWLPAALLVTGLLVRLAVWWAHRGYEPFGDEQYYYRAAVIFAQTGAYADPPTPAWLPVQRVPLLSLLAGGIFRLAGIDLGPVNLVQIGLSLATCWLVWRWATVLWGRAAGRWALALAVFSPPLITHSASFLYTETLYTFLAALALFLLGKIGADAPAAAPPAAVAPAEAAWPPLTRGTAGLTLLAGAAVGLTALTRSSGLALLGVGLLWLATAGRRAPRRAAALALLLVLGCGLVVAPWTARNYRAYGGFLLLDTIGAYNLWRDNALPGENPAATLVKLPNPIEQGRVATERGLANLRAHPERFLAKLPATTLFLWHLELDSYARGGGYFEDLTNRADSFAWTLAADLAHLLVNGLALAALPLLAWRRGRAPAQTRLQALLLLWIVANMAPGIVFHSESRFRIPYLPQLTVFAALPLAAGPALLARARAAPWRGGLAAGLLLLMLAGAWSPRLLPVLHMQAWVTAGDLLGRLDRPAALGAYERAAAAFPTSDRPRVILGQARQQAGDPAGAADAYAAALALQPHNLAAAVPLAHIHRQAGREEEARRVLRASGASDTDLLSWGWRNAEPPPRAAVLLGAGLEAGYVTNVYPPERAGDVAFRWTNGAGQVRLTTPAGGAPRLTLRLNGTRLGQPPAAGVRILVNGRLVDTVVTDGAWQTVSLDVSALNLQPGARVLVEVRSDTFVPAQSLPGNRDTRRLGVALERVALEEP